jgi:hypothetical protein
MEALGSIIGRDIGIMRILVALPSLSGKILGYCLDQTLIASFRILSNLSLINRRVIRSYVNIGTLSAVHNWIESSGVVKERHGRGKMKNLRC